VITHLNTKAVYLSDLDNRKMVLSIECISGGGFALKSMIILAGTVLMEKHFNNMIDNGILFAISESGYSNAYLGLEWLKHFDKQMVSRQQGKY
jgi:DDE superfamily endonuclease